jgi:hypothetical protein
MLQSEGKTMQLLYHAYNTGLTVDLQNIAYFSVRNAIFDSTGD